MGMLKAGEAAERLHLSESTLAKLRMTGSGPVFLKLGRKVMYMPDDLDAWLASKRRTGTWACNDNQAREAAPPGRSRVTRPE